MKIEINLPGVKPISLNNSKAFGRGRCYKVDKAIQFESLVNNVLRNSKNELNKINKKYDENKHYMVCSYRFYMPIFIKDGSRLSKTAGDCSNIVKELEDLIFKQLHADDSCVCGLYIDKIHSENIRISVTFQIKDLMRI